MFCGGAMRSTKRVPLAVCFIVLGITAVVSAQTRIRFARGRTSATVNGSINGGAKRTFALGARSGQTFSGNVSSRNGCVKFTEGSTNNSYTTHAGDNVVSITNYCGRATSFVLTVSIN